jgi:hypothetical protein
VESFWTYRRIPWVDGEIIARIVPPAVNAGKESGADGGSCGRAGFGGRPTARDFEEPVVQLAQRLPAPQRHRLPAGFTRLGMLTEATFSPVQAFGYRRHRLKRCLTGGGGGSERTSAANGVAVLGDGDG